MQAKWYTKHHAADATVAYRLPSEAEWEYVRGSKNIAAVQFGQREHVGDWHGESPRRYNSTLIARCGALALALP